MKNTKEAAIIGQRIKARREDLGMTQEALAFAVDYKSRTSINKIELGKTDLPQSMVKKLAVVLRCTPGYIMGDADTADLAVNEKTSTPSIESGRSAEFRDLFVQLTADEQSLVISQIKGILSNR